MNEYMATIRPSYGIGSFDEFFNAENDDDAIRHAKSITSEIIGEKLYKVYRVVGRKGVKIWDCED